jgi:hypothetical protein
VDESAFGLENGGLKARWDFEASLLAKTLSVL